MVGGGEKVKARKRQDGKEQVSEEQRRKGGSEDKEREVRGIENVNGEQHKETGKGEDLCSKDE